MKFQNIKSLTKVDKETTTTDVEDIEEQGSEDNE